MSTKSWDSMELSLEACCSFSPSNRCLQALHSEFPLSSELELGVGALQNLHNIVYCDCCSALSSHGSLLGGSRDPTDSLFTDTVSSEGSEGCELV